MSDRKPVDPPPIVQLQIKDPLDQAQNYLQSPYLFLCACLCHADLDDPERLPADKVLCGTLVSSLHRLKDVDNKDGGFFVFGDMSVKIEGEFRLRFVLFEMCKTEVVFIKSVTSQAFSVFHHKVFPGMSESTFLSRSFGDQGVRLRIRKEPRSLCKRPASSLRSEEFPASFEDSSTPAQREMPKHGCGRPTVGAGSYPNQYTSLAEPPVKRQRTSVDMSDRPVFDTDRLSQRSFMDQRAPYNFPAAPQVTSSFPQTYSQSSQSALSSVSDYSYGHQKTNSSSTSSPFVSPHTDGSGQSWSATNVFYSTSLKDPLYPYPQAQYPQGQYSQNQYPQGQYSQNQYSQGQYLEMQPPRAPQASDPLARQRGPELPNRAQINPNFTFPRAQDPETSSAGNYSQIVRPTSTSSNYNDLSARLPSTDQISDLAASSRQQYPATTLSNILPPIDPPMNSGQHRGPSQMLSNNIISSMEPHTMVAGQSVQVHENESYDHNAYILPLPNHKESDDG
ncbi:MAG: hypothetical protein Q9203_002640 [Teloschistes exilis]